MSDVDASAVAAATEAARADLPTARAELEELVRIPSISADPERVRDVAESADAVAALLEASGLEHVRQASVDGCPPCVIGDWLHESPAAVFAALQKGKEPPAGGDAMAPMAGMAMKISRRAAASQGCLHTWPLRARRASPVGGPQEPAT